MYYRCLCNNETFKVRYLRLLCTKCGREYIADTRLTSEGFNRYKTILNEMLYTGPKKKNKEMVA